MKEHKKCRFRKVSVIIPTLNTPQIGNAVASVLANTSPVPYEVIVVGKDDRGLVPRTPPVRFVDVGTPVSAGAARNRGAAEAAGDLLLFTDADCIADRDWIVNSILSAMKTEQEVVVGGLRFPEDNFWNLGYHLAASSAYHVSARPRKVAGPFGAANLAIRRELFIEVGGYQTDLGDSQDWEFTTRIRAKGIRVRFDPSFAVRRQGVRASRRSVVEHARSHARGREEMLRAAGEPLRVSQTEPATRFPAVAVALSAARATLKSFATLAAQRSLLRYAYAWPAAWTFLYARRRELCRLRAAQRASHAGTAPRYSDFSTRLDLKDGYFRTGGTAGLP